MRKLSLFLLLATVTAPALAQASDDRRGRDNRKSSSEQSESRQQRGSESRAQRASERRGPDAREQRQSGGQRSVRSQANQQGSTDRIREHVLQQRLQRQQATSNRSGSDSGVQARRRGGDGVRGQAQTNWRERERTVRTIPDTRPTTTQRSTSRRDGYQSRDRRDYRDGHYNRWSHNWRNDRRYDWRRYRDRNRSSFRIGIYYDPFGYNYRRWSVGSRLNSGYYRSNYWLHDPWQYRLPPAYGPYRWVRYWNDALLVNTYTGEVVDVIHGFFW